MSIEGGKFLDTKYKDLAGSHEVVRAVEKAKDDSERKFAPHTREERIEAYLDRLDYIITDERGWRRLKQKVVNELGVDVDDDVTLNKLAHGLYEAEKRLAAERGQGRQFAAENSGKDAILRFEEKIVGKRMAQEEGLEKWLDYLKDNDAEYPTWFQYFVVRNLGKMGTLNKEKGEYSKRSNETLAPFPELNSEALGFVYRMLTTGLGSEEFQDDPAMRKTFLELIAKKDFSRLYAFAQIETAGALNREYLEGEWVKYDQGSDHHALENSLRGKGTGWCTAEGSAYSHIQGGDFYVYYSRGPKGTYSEPRVAIRMNEGQIAEVRGVNHRQELEPELYDIAAEKYRTLSGGEKYDKKSADMKRVTELYQKGKKGESFTQDEIDFLLEIEGPIEGFGYDKDPRIGELVPFEAEHSLKGKLKVTVDQSLFNDIQNARSAASEKDFYMPGWGKNEWVLPTENFSVLILKMRDRKDYDIETIVAELEKCGLRPLTLAEMAAVGLEYKSDMQESRYDFVTPTVYADNDGGVVVPMISTYGTYALTKHEPSPFIEMTAHKRLLCTYK